MTVEVRTITTTVAALWIVVTGNLNPSVVTMIICGAALIPVLVFTSLWLRVDRLLNPISRFLLLIGTIIKSKLARRMRFSEPGAIEPVTNRLYQLIGQNDRLTREMTAAIAAATDELGQEKNQLATILASLSYGVILTTYDGTIIMCNESARKAIGDALTPGRILTKIFDSPALGESLTTVRNEGNRVSVSLGELKSVSLSRVDEDGLEGLLLCFEV